MGLEQVKFHRLEQHQIDIFVDLLKVGNNPKICDICHECLFEHPCVHIGKRIRDVLIESYAILVLDIAGKISNVRQRSDAIGEGMLALTTAVEEIPEDIKNIGAWIRVWVTRNMQRSLILDSIIHVPQYKKSQAHLRGSPSIRLDVSVECNVPAIDLLDLLKSIPKNDKEKIVMRCMIEEGYSLQDIADICNVTCARVSQIRQDLIARIQTELRRLV